MTVLLLLIFLLIFTFVFTFIMGSSVVGFIQTRVPYVRTRAADILEIVKKTPITETDVFFDLGSGDGKVIFTVEKNSGAKVKGFELTLWTHLLSRINKMVRRSSAQLVMANFFKRDFSEATVIYCYLYPALMPVVSRKVLAECKPGTKVIARDFPASDLNQIDRWKSSTGHTIYVYQV